MFDAPAPSSFSARIDEHYMNPKQLDYFKKKLLQWRLELEWDQRKSLKSMNDTDIRPIEEMERSVQAVDREIEIQNQVRIHDLIRKIDRALDRIEAGSYGYCEKTEEPIGIERLKASPVAAYCLGVQERIELRERKFSLRTR
jgi:DnaK suppressor protein